MCVIEKTLYSNDGAKMATYDSHIAAVNAMLNDYDENGKVLDVPIEGAKSNEA